MLVLGSELFVGLQQLPLAIDEVFVGVELGDDVVEVRVREANVASALDVFGPEVGQGTLACVIRSTLDMHGAGLFGVLLLSSFWIASRVF